MNASPRNEGEADNLRRGSRTTTEREWRRRGSSSPSRSSGSGRRLSLDSTENAISTTSVSTKRLPGIVAAGVIALSWIGTQVHAWEHLPQPSRDSMGSSVTPDCGEDEESCRICRLTRLPVELVDPGSVTVGLSADSCLEAPRSPRTAASPPSPHPVRGPPAA